MHNKTIAQMIKDLNAKTYSSVELTQSFLARIKKYDNELNSFITICDEQALAQAKQADEQRAAGKASNLCGIPVAQKDIFCTDGIKTTCGSKMLDNFVAPYDAHIIKQFNNAGCVMLGKANMDEFAMGSSGENSFYGASKNPWDVKRVPGGSSSGSAAAVAARLAPACTGTDTGGSIRQPAAFCGITGLKPTYGRVSRYGMVAFASSLDSAGLLTQNAEDAALLMNIMAGYDEKDSTSVKHEVPDYTASLHDSLQGKTIGLPKEFFNADLNPVMAKAIEEAKTVFTKMGVNFKEISLTHIAMSAPAYYIIAPAEASSNLARYDGVRYGYRCNSPVDLHDLYVRSRSEGLGDEVKRRIMVGTYALSAGYYDAYYNKARRIRRLILNDYQAAFADVDLILCPSTPTTAFKIGEKSANPLDMYLSDIYTIANNLAGMPGISIPTGFDEHKLPIGLQLTANHFCEAALLNAAHQYQQQTDWHQQVPAQFA